jgi:hypothetical protein
MEQSMSRASILFRVPKSKSGSGKSKYHNMPQRGCASGREADRCRDLELLCAAGKITNLQKQVRFVLIPKQNGERSVSYVADFTYNDEDGNFVVEDCKGFRTPMYLLKKKMMLFFHKIKIKET